MLFKLNSVPYSFISAGLELQLMVLLVSSSEKLNVKAPPAGHSETAELPEQVTPAARRDMHIQSADKYYYHKQQQH